MPGSVVQKFRESNGPSGHVETSKKCSRTTGASLRMSVASTRAPTSSLWSRPTVDSVRVSSNASISQGNRLSVEQPQQVQVMPPKKATTSGRFPAPRNSGAECKPRDSVKGVPAGTLPTPPLIQNNMVNDAAVQTTEKYRRQSIEQKPDDVFGTPQPNVKNRISGQEDVHVVAIGWPITILGVCTRILFSRPIDDSYTL